MSVFFHSKQYMSLNAVDNILGKPLRAMSSTHTLLAEDAIPGVFAQLEADHL